MKETSRKQSIFLMLNPKQSFCIVTRLADIDVCADERCGADTVEMIFSNLLKTWPKFPFPADVGCCNVREVDVLSHRHCVLQTLCSSSVVIAFNTGASTSEISLCVLRG